MQQGVTLQYRFSNNVAVSFKWNIICNTFYYRAPTSVYHPEFIFFKQIATVWDAIPSQNLTDTLTITQYMYKH